MTSVYGYYEIYDYSALQSPDTVYKKREYPPTSTMGKICKTFPKFTFLAQLAGLDWQLADPQNMATLFLPIEESMPIEWVRSCDRGLARRFVKYHFTMGYLPRDVLHTSLCYKLRSTIKGQDILVQRVNDRFLFNGVSVLSYDNLTNNGVVHIIQRPLMDLVNFSNFQ